MDAKKEAEKRYSKRYKNNAFRRVAFIEGSEWSKEYVVTETLQTVLEKIRIAKDNAGTNQKIAYMVDESSILRAIELIKELA